MDPTYVTLSVRDVEKVYLEAFPISYPDWRRAHSSHQPHPASTRTHASST